MKNLTLTYNREPENQAGYRFTDLHETYSRLSDTQLPRALAIFP
jgi:hypothetical protein